MSTDNAPVQTKRQSTAKRTRNGRPATARLRRQATEVGNDLQAMSGTAREAANEQMGQLGENAAELYEQGCEKAHQVSRTLEQFILDQPLKSLLIAGGVGLLLGRFWLRR